MFDVIVVSDDNGFIGRLDNGPCWEGFLVYRSVFAKVLLIHYGDSSARITIQLGSLHCIAI